MTTANLDAELALRLRVETLLADYVHCIDDDRLEAWPDFFSDDGRYKIITRENHEQGLPVGIVYCDGRGMLEDRITAMRTANIYEPHTYRHMVSAVQVLDRADGECRTQTNFTVTRVMHDGETSAFACGKYLDRIVERGGALKFKERLVVLDSRRIDTLLVIPI